MAPPGSSVKLRVVPHRRPPARSTYTLALMVLLWLVSGCASAPPALPRAPRAELDALARAPELTGTLIYDGDVFAADDSVTPRFRYQRRVRVDGAGQVSTHLTRGARDPAVLIQLAATHDLAFALFQLTQIDVQSGVVGHARMLDAHHLAFERRTGDHVRTRVETVREPVVVGPTLFGYALAHWEVLLEGRVLRVRFASIDLLRTFGFELRLLERDEATTVLSFRARDPLVRAAVPPMRLVFDSTTREIIRYEGRVPPKLAVRGRLRALDARVEYRFDAPFR